MKSLTLVLAFALSGCGLPALMSGEFFPEDAKLKRLEGRRVYYFTEDSKYPPVITQFVHSDGSCSYLKTQAQASLFKKNVPLEDWHDFIDSEYIRDGKPDYRNQFCPKCVPDPY